MSHNAERLSLVNKNFLREIIAFNTSLKLNPFTPLEILLRNAF